MYHTLLVSLCIHCCIYMYTIHCCVSLCMALCITVYGMCMYIAHIMYVLEGETELAADIDQIW